MLITKKLWETEMKPSVFSMLLAGIAAWPLCAGTVLELPLNQADSGKGWNRGAENVARILNGPDGKPALEIRLEQPVKNHVYGISRSLNPAQIAGRRVTLSAEVQRDVKVYQKWQGGKLMLCVKLASGRNEYFGIYMESGSFDWKTLSKSFDIPQDLVSASLFLGLQGGTGVIRYRNLKVESGDLALDLGKYANMGYSDPVANDGKGGWSDQGPENDASKFRRNQTTFGKVPFHLTDPAKNQGKSVLTFGSKRFPNGLSSVEIDLGKTDGKAKYLYLLHTLTFPDSYPPVGTITVTGAGGDSQTLKIINGRDVANWWMPSKKPNAFPISIWQNGGGNQVGVYLSKFKLNVPGAIRKLKISREDASAANWIILGITLSEQDYPFPQAARITMQADQKWKVLPLPAKGGIVAGSALDLSFLNDGKPAGTHGRVIVNRNGHFAFEKEPDRPIRFLSTAEGPSSWRGFWANKPQFDSKEKIREYVRQLRLAGYNMIRIHFLDEILLTKAEKDLDFNADYLDRFDFLVAECGRNGIYLNMDAMTSRLGYAKGKRWGWKGSPATPGNFKHEIYFSERVRQNWKEGVRKLFTHRNPYTGKRLVDDPVLALVVGFNEQEFGLSSCADYNGLLPLWKTFLKKKYKTVQALQAAWGKNAPSTFEKIAIFRQDDVHRSDAMGADINQFLIEQENSIFHFYKDFLREIGYRGPVSAMNMGKSFRHAAARRDFDFITMNSYHAHPNGYTTNGGGVISQASSIGDAGNILRGFASMRLYGKPFLITEHLHVFWNKYRYEQGFVTGAYAAFQDFDGLTGFGSNITINPYVPPSPFQIGNDPIAKTQEFLTALLFLRRDVTPGKHLIRLALSSEEFLKNGAANDGLSTAQGKLILTNRFAYTCDQRIPTGKNEIILGRSGGAGIIVDPWYSSLLDSKESLFHLDRYLNHLRKSGVLPARNRSSDASGIYETETGELRMETRRNYLQLNTLRLQGICAEAGSSAKLSDFEIRKMTTRGNLALASIDGTRPIREAKRLLLVVATNVLNSGMTFEDPEQRFLLKLGTMPVLLETGTFELAFRSRCAKELKAYALGMDGTRIAELPLRKQGDRVELSLNTAAIPNGPALYFEFAR